MIPTVIVLFGAVYTSIVLDDIEAKASDRDGGRRHRPAVRVALRLPRSGRHLQNELHVPADRSSISPERARRPALLLGPGVGHQARPRPGSDPAATRSTTRSRHPRRIGHLQSSAPSSAAAATPRCGRRSVVEPQADVRRVAQGPGEDCPTDRQPPARRRGHGAGVRRQIAGWAGGWRTCGSGLSRPGLGAGGPRGPPRGRVRLRPGRRPARDLRAPAFQTEQTGYPHIIVPAITGPLGFLVGIGCFDYWFRWAVGAPTHPRRPLPARRHELAATTSSSTPTTR